MSTRNVTETGKSRNSPTPRQLASLLSLDCRSCVFGARSARWLPHIDARAFACARMHVAPHVGTSRLRGRSVERIRTVLGAIPGGSYHGACFAPAKTAGKSYWLPMDAPSMLPGASADPTVDVARLFFNGRARVWRLALFQQARPGHIRVSSSRVHVRILSCEGKGA